MKGFTDALGDLANPAKFRARIDLKNASTDWALAAYRNMMLIRRAEEAIADLYSAGETRTPIHLGVGQEAVAVGVSSQLTRDDRVYSGHRGHSHYLALSGSLRAMMAEILGRATGASGGMGGSMHLYAPDVGFQGSVPIVGATIPIAVGAGLACKMDGKSKVAVCYFGDGACEEGVLHESLNLARIMDLPVLFVCENNLYSSHLDIHLRQPSNSVERFAKAHHIRSRLVDGNDVAAVAEATRELVSASRAGEGPGFLEAITFRWRGHVGPSVDIDVGIRRSPEELAAWKERDPLRRLADSLFQERGQTQDVLQRIEAEIMVDISEAIKFARSAAPPAPAALLDYVYAGTK